MSTRIYNASLTVALLLAGCGQDKDQPLRAPETKAKAKAADETLVPCRVDGAIDMQPVCRIEPQADGSALTIRHPGGGFRRFRIVTDGRGIIPADGAEQATIAIRADNRIDVTVAGDAYQLPATIATPGA